MTRPSIRGAIADGWALAQPFWRAPGQRRAWLLLASVVVLTLGTVWLNVQFSTWNNSFYNTLQKRDLAGFWRQLGVFCVLAAAFIAAAVYRQYLQQLLFMRWRTWLTARLLEGWLHPGTAFRMMARTGEGLDNPDQRIAEDARGFVSSTLELTLGLLNAFVTLASFVGILWGLSGTLSVPLGAGFRIPGYMVWVAIGYSLFGTWITHRLGRPLIGLSNEQQKVEADFRYALVQVRDHAEAIALARGEPREKVRLADRFDAVRDNWSGLIRTTKRMTWFSAGYGQVANVFPILAAAPRYFGGGLQLGDHVLVSGPSGAGKSSLIRAIAGLWRKGQGSVALPADATLMFVPQRPYLPDGTLRDALAYPLAPADVDPEATHAAVVLAGLGRYAGQLDVHRRWATILSPGEQQRVHFARVLLHRPDWVFLDESTSALDEASEQALYRRLRSTCPSTTVVSIGHRSTLTVLHDRTWALGTGGLRPVAAAFAEDGAEHRPEPLPAEPVQRGASARQPAQMSPVAHPHVIEPLDRFAGGVA